MASKVMDIKIHLDPAPEVVCHRCLGPQHLAFMTLEPPRGGVDFMGFPGRLKLGENHKREKWGWVKIH